MNSIRKVLTGSILGLSIVTAAVAQTPPPPPPDHAFGEHHGREHGPWAMLSQLGLSAEQKTQIKTIMSNAHPQMTSMHQQMRANEQKLMETSPTDSTYKAVVDQVSTADAGLHAQMVQQRASIRAQIFTVLTPAQQQQLQALEAQHMQRMAQHESGPHGE